MTARPSSRLSGRIALITGASRGIGWALVKRFAAEGASVVAVSRTEDALARLDEEVRAEGFPPLVQVAADLRDAETTDRIAAEIFERFGRLDVLVANAGLLGSLGPMGHIKPAQWDEVIATNLTANWHLLRYMEPLLKLSDAGRAVFLTSSVGRFPRAQWGVYAVSKAGLDMMVKTWAAEIEKTSLRVNLYDPGGTRTPMRAQAYPGEDPETLPPPEAHCDPILDLSTPECRLHGQIIAFKDLQKRTA